jgi:carbamoyl-phosphate synthase large subunit
MKTILITAIAGDIAQSIALIVRETFPEWRVLGCDIHDRHGAELVVDEWFIAPRATSPDYKLWLETIVVKERIDLCVPMSEAELLLLAQTKISSIGGALLIMPNRQAIKVGGDKLETARFLESLGCPVPWTIPAADSNSETPFPCIIKPRRSAGSKAVFVCNTLQEAQFYWERCPESVLQELLLPDDQEVTCAVYRTQAGSVGVLQLLRTLVGGFTGWARVINDPEVLKQCECVAEALGLQGSINVQLRITNQGPRIFEINPRFSSTILIRHMMGYQDVVWALREGMGMPVKLTTPVVGVTAVRTQGARLLSHPAKSIEP